MVLLLSRFRKELKAGMGQSIFDGHRCAGLDHQPDQSLVTGHGHAANTALGETVGSGQTESVGLRIVAVQRADLAVGGHRHLADHPFQSLLTVFGTVDQAGHILDDPKDLIRPAIGSGLRTAGPYIFLSVRDGGSIHYAQCLRKNGYRGLERGVRPAPAAVNQSRRSLVGP